jgi:hypothetical protein
MDAIGKVSGNAENNSSRYALAGFSVREAQHCRDAAAHARDMRSFPINSGTGIAFKKAIIEFPAVLRYAIGNSAFFDDAQHTVTVEATTESARARELETRDHFGHLFIGCNRMQVTAALDFLSDQQVAVTREHYALLFDRNASDFRIAVVIAVQNIKPKHA